MNKLPISKIGAIEYKLFEGVGNKALNLGISDNKDYKDEILEYYISQAIELDS